MQSAAALLAQAAQDYQQYRADLAVALQSATTEDRARGFGLAKLNEDAELARALQGVAQVYDLNMATELEAIRQNLEQGENEEALRMLQNWLPYATWTWRAQALKTLPTVDRTGALLATLADTGLTLELATRLGNFTAEQLQMGVVMSGTPEAVHVLRQRFNFPLPPAELVFMQQNMPLYQYVLEQTLASQEQFFAEIRDKIEHDALYALPYILRAYPGYTARHIMNVITKLEQSAQENIEEMEVMGLYEEGAENAIPFIEGVQVLANLTGVTRSMMQMVPDYQGLFDNVLPLNASPLNALMEIALKPYRAKHLIPFMLQSGPYTPEEVAAVIIALDQKTTEQYPEGRYDASVKQLVKKPGVTLSLIERMTRNAPRYEGWYDSMLPVNNPAPSSYAVHTAAAAA